MFLRAVTARRLRGTTDLGAKRWISTIPVTEPGSYARDAGIEGSHLYSIKWHKKLGPVFRDYDLGAVFLSDPALVEQVLGGGDKYPKLYIPPAWTYHSQVYGQQRGLMFKEGEEWWQARKKLNPLLLKSQALSSMHSVLDQDVDHLIQVLKLDRTVIEEKDIYRMLVNSMMKVFLGEFNSPSDNRTTADIADQVIIDARGLFDATASLMLVNVEEAAKNESEDWLKFCRHTNSIMSMLKNQIRLAGDNLGGVAGHLERGGMSKSEIEKIVADLMLGGMDTTAVTVSWIIYALASNQQLQESLRQEVKKVCGEEKSRCELTADMHLCKGMIKEAMRLFPVAPFLTRVISEPLELGSYQLPAGTFLAISSYVMGRDPHVFPEPERPLPERWTRRDLLSASERHRMAFSSLPFGHGVRMCIGRRLAELQMLALVAKVLQELELSTTCNVEYITRMLGMPRIKPVISIKPINDD